MRKIFLVSLMAGAMFAVAAPAASIAAKPDTCHVHSSHSRECICPPGTDNPAYCVRATPHETADACVSAGVAAAANITDASKSITFSFKAGVTGECHFTLLFADPGSGKPGHPAKYVIVGQAVIHTTAGATSTATVQLNAIGLAFIATDNTKHLTQLFEVVGNEVTTRGSGNVHSFGSFVV